MVVCEYVCTWPPGQEWCACLSLVRPLRHSAFACLDSIADIPTTTACVYIHVHIDACKLTNERDRSPPITKRIPPTKQTDYWDSINLKNGAYAPVALLDGVKDFLNQLSPNAGKAQQAMNAELPYELLRRSGWVDGDGGSLDGWMDGWMDGTWIDSSGAFSIFISFVFETTKCREYEVRRYPAFEGARRPRAMMFDVDDDGWTAACTSRLITFAPLPFPFPSPLVKSIYTYTTHTNTTKHANTNTNSGGDKLREPARGLRPPGHLRLGLERRGACVLYIPCRVSGVDRARQSPARTQATLSGVDRSYL
jgi:hypothetical protein